MKESGLGARVINFVVDTILVFLLALVAFKWWSFYARFWGRTYIPYYLFFFAMSLVYYTLLEGLWGRTPGKLLSLTQVRTFAGRKPSLAKAFIRSLVRFTLLIDAAFLPIKGQTLHDLLSKTHVEEV